MASNPTGLITVDHLLRVLCADRFFLEAVGGPADPEGKPLAEVLGAAKGEDPLDEIADRGNKCGEIETERKGPRGRKRLLRVSYARAKLENDESAIFVTVEALPKKK